MSNFQNGLWAFLFFMLAGPFFAAVATALAVPILMLLHVAPFDNANVDLFGSFGGPVGREMLSVIGINAMQAYIWAAIPSALSGLMFAAMVAGGWQTSWATAGITGVVGFMIAVIFMPFEDGGLLTFIAFGAGLIAIACRSVLLKAGVLKLSSTS